MRVQEIGGPEEYAKEVDKEIGLSATDVIGHKEEKKEEQKVEGKKKKKGAKLQAGQTKEEQEKLMLMLKAYGVKEEPEITASGIDFSKSVDNQLANEEGDAKKEIMKFPTFCYACDKEGQANMCFATIPFFKEIIIMAFHCDYCGYRSTEVKQGGGISDKATRIILKVEKEEDLNRDVFKSDTCVVAIPELDFAMAPGTLGSMYTTVEGLLTKVIESLRENNPFGVGDSSTNDKFLTFLDQMEALKTFPPNNETALLLGMESKTRFTLVLDDAVSNCFIHNPFAPDNDPQIDITIYERTEE